MYGIWYKTCEVSYFDHFTELPINTICLVNKVGAKLDVESGGDRVSYYKDKDGVLVDCGQLYIYQGKRIYQNEVYLCWRQFTYDNNDELTAWDAYILTTVIDLSEYGVIEIPDLAQYEI